MNLSFTCLPGDYAITRLSADAPFPDWLEGEGLVSVTRADHELSIVTRANRAPDHADAGWAALRVQTLAELDEPGVIQAAVTPISSAGLGVFVISTHLRDYLLVRTTELPLVKATLSDAGHALA